MAEEVTNAQAETAFRIQVGSREENVATRVTALDPALDQVVDFLTRVGFAAPFRLVVDVDGTLLVVDGGLGAVLRVDPENGTRTIVSGGSIGSGPPIETPFEIAVEPQGSLIVVDLGDGSFIPPAVMRVDPDSGDRRVIFGGPPFLFISGIDVEMNGALVVVSFGGIGSDGSVMPPAVMPIDPESGSLTVISGGSEGIGSGPPLHNPSGIAIEADGSFLVVNGGGNAGLGGPSIPPAVIRVDPESGDRTLVSGGTDNRGRGALLDLILDIVVGADDSIMVVGGVLDDTFRPYISGARTVVSGDSVGRGPAFVTPFDIAVEDNGFLLVVDRGGLGVDNVLMPPAVVQLDPDSGDRTVVSGGVTNIGSGPPFVYPSRAYRKSFTSRLAHSAAVIPHNHAVPPAEKAEISCHEFTKRSTSGSAVGDNGFLVVVDRGGRGADGNRIPPAVVQVDVQSGVRSLVSGGMGGRGGGLEPLVTPLDAAVEANGSLLVVDCGGRGGFFCPSQPENVGFPPAVVRVAPNSGDRKVVSGGATNVGSGPQFVFSADLAIKTDGALVVVGGAITPASVVQVDPESGDRKVVSGGAANVGSGSPFVGPIGVIVAPDGSLVIAEALFGAIIRVDARSGNRVVISR